MKIDAEAARNIPPSTNAQYSKFGAVKPVSGGTIERAEAAIRARVQKFAQGYITGTDLKSKLVNASKDALAVAALDINFISVVENEFVLIQGAIPYPQYSVFTARNWSARNLRAPRR